MTQIEETLVEYASGNPEYEQGVQMIEERLSQTPIVAEDLLEAIEMLELALLDPEKYPAMVEAAIADNILDVGDAPEQFDAVFIISLLLVLYGLRDSLNRQGYARGGLMVAGRHLANRGQGGDSMLAHVNPREAEILRRMGGQGTVNPNTGIAEYKSLKKILKIAAPIALSFIAPGIGTAIGTSLGFGSTLGPIVGQALVGAGTSALTGGDWKKGAVMGALGAQLPGGGNISGQAGTFLNKNLGLNLTDSTANLLGGALTGAAGSALAGGDPLTGALGGAGGEYLKGIGASLDPNSTAARALSGAANTGSKMLMSGYPLQQAAIGALGGALFKTVAPSKAVTDEIKSGGRRGDLQFDMMETGSQSKVGEDGFFTKLLSGDIDLEKGLGMAALGMGALGALQSSSDPEVADASRYLSEDQKEYFNRPAMVWDWEKLKRDANRANMNLGSFMSRNWNLITGGNYNRDSSDDFSESTSVDFSVDKRLPVSVTPLDVDKLQAAEWDKTQGLRFGHGGALTHMAYVQGKGTGRSDEIPAYLSDGEYVIDAETVSMLGDGSNKAGAQALNSMRKSIRKHKGGALAKGKFSADAKSPLEYLQEGAA
jgi:hypothetical protein